MVLLLDDDAGFRSALAQNLREDGHDVRAFERPADLPNLDELSQVHVLVTDYSFGRGEDGLDLSMRFNAVHPGKPAILLTAYADGLVEEGVAHLPFLRLLTKPLRYEVLHGLIHSLVF